MSTPIKPQNHTAANTQELESIVSYSIALIFDFEKCLVPFALLLCSCVAQGLKDHGRAARTEKSLWEKL